jgi:hypothetical protein
MRHQHVHGQSKKCRDGQNRILIYLCTVYDRISGDIPAKSTVYVHHIYLVLAQFYHVQKVQWSREGDKACKLVFVYAFMHLQRVGACSV